MRTTLFVATLAGLGTILWLSCDRPSLAMAAPFDDDPQSDVLQPAQAIGADRATGETSVPNPRALPCGLPDTGIFSDLDEQVTCPLPPVPRTDKITLLINKAARTLSVVYDGVPIKTYPVALGFTPQGDKQREGDGKTPEGTYSIAEKTHENLPAKYGARSMLLSYPSTKDAQRGLAQGLIDATQQARIENAIDSGEIPPHDTVLGSSIRIHGGGVGEDWTAGCVALRDPDVIELYDLVGQGTRVQINKGSQGVADRDRDGIPDPVDAAMGALKADLNNAHYDGSYHKIPYPGGDVDRTIGVCTDVIIRALRNAGIDLQKAMQDDIAAAPKSYRSITAPNPSIDHRRVTNMVVYLKRHMKSLPPTVDAQHPENWLPGDIVLFDTLPKDGPDHIGVVSPNMGPDGLPLVINNWTTGAVTDEMDLLSWCPVTHHFRLP